MENVTERGHEMCKRMPLRVLISSFCNKCCSLSATSHLPFRLQVFSKSSSHASPKTYSLGATRLSLKYCFPGWSLLFFVCRFTHTTASSATRVDLVDHPQETIPVGRTENTSCSFNKCLCKVSDPPEKSSAFTKQKCCRGGLLFSRKVM